VLRRFIIQADDTLPIAGFNAHVLILWRFGKSCYCSKQQDKGKKFFHFYDFTGLYFDFTDDLT